MNLVPLLSVQVPVWMIVSGCTLATLVRLAWPLNGWRRPTNLWRQHLLEAKEKVGAPAWSVATAQNSRRRRCVCTCRSMGLSVGIPGGPFMASLNIAERRWCVGEPTIMVRDCWHHSWLQRCTWRGIQGRNRGVCEGLLRNVEFLTTTSSWPDKPMSLGCHCTSNVYKDPVQHEHRLL